MNTIKRIGAHTVVLFLLLLILPVVLNPVRAQGPTGIQDKTTDSAPFITTTVDDVRTFGHVGNRSLALDAAGRPHIAYGGDHLYHA